jgi:flagellar basal-body rod protein FlgC
MKIQNLNALFSLTLALGVASPGMASVQPRCSDSELASLEALAASSNLANIYTTRTPEGGPYKKKIAIRHKSGQCEIQSVEAFRTIHEPGHPDADKQGFVRFPDINFDDEEKILEAARAKLNKLKSSPGRQDLFSDIDYD